MIDDIKLPALPNDSETPASSEWQWSDEDMRDYALAAIKYDRQRRGDPVAYAVFADNGNIRIWQHEPLDWPEAVPLYSAPQPAAPAQEPSDALMDALRNQRQIDRDGSEVGVSRQALDEAIALLARYGTTQPSVPEGWKLVPVEPTENMLEGIRTGSRKDWPSDELCRVRYVAMLAAAPKFGEEE